MDALIKLSLEYNGKTKMVLINGGDEESLLARIAERFDVDFAEIARVSVQDTADGSVAPFSICSLKKNHHYKLIIHFNDKIESGENNAIPPPLPENNSENMQDFEYFNGYAKLAIHRTMLQDKQRTQLFKKGIEECRDHIKDRIVLDVGTGTGILAIFAAKMGAQNVFSIDASSIIRDAALIIKANGLQNITVYEGKVEDITLPVKKVDVIVSEWMGSMLLFESMIVSVINARDRYLRDGGIVLPSHCSLFLAPVDVREFVHEHLGFWDDVEGVDMAVLKAKAAGEFFCSPIFNRTVQPEQLLSAGQSFFSFDMKTIDEAQINSILSSFEYKIEKNGQVSGFVCWFDVKFRETVLSTSPAHPETHWKQTLLVFDDFPEVGAGQVLQGIIYMSRNSVWRRHYEVTLKYWVKETRICFQKMFTIPMTP